MKLFKKKLFKKKLSKKKRQREITNFIMPFKPSELKFPEAYVEVLLGVIKRENPINEMDEFLLEFGTPSTMHIMCYRPGPLYVQMEPQKNGWSGNLIWVGDYEGAAEDAEDDQMVFQFKFPTPNYVKTPEPNRYSKAEYTRVYSFCPADEVDDGSNDKKAPE